MRVSADSMQAQFARITRLCNTYPYSIPFDCSVHLHPLESSDIERRILTASNRLMRGLLMSRSYPQRQDKAELGKYGAQARLEFICKRHLRSVITQRVAHRHKSWKKGKKKKDYRVLNLTPDAVLALAPRAQSLNNIQNLSGLS